MMRAIKQSSLPTPKNPENAPVITSGNPEIQVEFSQFSYQIVATNNPTYFGASNLPAGLNLNTSTGVISGTAPAWGEYQITVSASNADGSDSKQISLGFTTALNKAGVNYSAIESEYCTNPSSKQIYSNSDFIGSSTIIYLSDKVTKGDAGYYGLIGQSNYFYYDGNHTITEAGTCP